METAAAVVWTRLVKPGILTALEMADRMSLAAHEYFHVGVGRLGSGLPANVVIFDPKAKWTVAPEKFKSGSRNCPFNGWDLEGRVMYTIVQGEVKYRAAVH